MGSRIRGLQPSNASAMLRHPVLCRPLLRPGLPPELPLNGLHDEVHEGDVVGHAVELQAAVKLLRNAGRQLRPDFLGLRHLCRWAAGATATPATTANGLRLRDYRCHSFLLLCRLLGNGLRWATGT